MQLNPSESFIIARQLEDSSDAATYYVRAVIKDAANTTLETINLTDRGSQFFSKSWTVPADTTGNGRWITIQTSVYTDASYSTLSTLYGVRLDSYLIQQRTNANLNLGGAGGDISYKKIREIVQEIVDSKEQKPVDLSSLHTKFTDLEKGFSGISFDIQPLEKRLDELAQFIKDIPPQEKVDLSFVKKGLSTLRDELDTWYKTMAAMPTQDQMDMCMKQMAEVSKKIDTFEQIFSDNLRQLPVVTTLGDVEHFIKSNQPDAMPEKKLGFKKILGV